MSKRRRVRIATNNAVGGIAAAEDAQLPQAGATLQGSVVGQRATEQRAAFGGVSGGRPATRVESGQSAPYGAYSATTPRADNAAQGASVVRARRRRRA